MAFFSNKLKEKGVDAILVGGEAIDIYTAGTFATSDIDLVVNNRAVTEKLLNKFGFRKEDNGLWFNRDLNIVIQVIADSYSGDTAKVRIFKVKEYELQIAAPEDLIVNRLYSMKAWKSNPQLDFEQAVSLLRLNPATIDNEYLDSLAEKNGVVDVLDQARKVVRKSVT